LSLKKAKKRQIFSGLHWFARFQFSASKSQVGVVLGQKRSLIRPSGVEKFARYFQPEPLTCIPNPHRGLCVTLPLACFDEPLPVNHIVIPVVGTHGFALLGIDHRVNFAPPNDSLSVSLVVISLIRKALLPFRLIILLFFRIGHARGYPQSQIVSNFFLQVHICMHTHRKKQLTYPWRGLKLVTIEVMWSQ